MVTSFHPITIENALYNKKEQKNIKGTVHTKINSRAHAKTVVHMSKKVENVCSHWKNHWANIWLYEVIEEINFHTDIFNDLSLNNISTRITMSEPACIDKRIFKNNWPAGID